MDNASYLTTTHQRIRRKERRHTYVSPQQLMPYVAQLWPSFSRLLPGEAFEYRAGNLLCRYESTHMKLIALISLMLVGCATYPIPENYKIQVTYRKCDDAGVCKRVTEELKEK